MQWNENDTFERLSGAPEHIAHAFQKAAAIIGQKHYERIACSVSGGSDSDVMMDLIWRVDKDHKVRYVFFNTGVEYRATLEHLDYLEEKYGVKIERIAPTKSIPVCANTYGQPLISKFVSEEIERLQKHGFQWDDLSYEELLKKYPDCPTSPLRWWSNAYRNDIYQNGSEGRTMFNIDRNKYLREFIIQNPPSFKVSPSCCQWAKKKPSKKYCEDEQIQLLCTGVRKAEGGIRSVSYQSCYTQKVDGMSTFRPIFWFSDEDKEDYCQRFGVIHSRCYTEYGLKRTGCTGCPYNRKLFDEIGMVAMHEPQMIKAANNMFKESYAWTKAYREYAEMKNKGFCQLRLI